MGVHELPLVLKLDAAGNPQHWITYEQSAYYYAKDLVAWSFGEVDFSLRGGTCAATGKQSVLTMNTIIAVRGKSKAKNPVMRVPLSNKTLFRRDRHICAYCGYDYPENQLTRDHIQPVSRAGKNTWMNVVTACASCNKAKDDRTPEEANMHLLYVPYEPTRAEYLILEKRNILFDQMEFLLARVSKESRLLKDKDKLLAKANVRTNA